MTEPKRKNEEMPPDPFEVEEEVRGLTVIEHHHDVQAGVYRVLIGRPVLRAGEHVGTFDVVDYVFDDSDARWFTPDGERRTDDVVAAEQRVMIKAAIEQRAQAEVVQQPSPRSLPGVGDAL